MNKLYEQLQRRLLLIQLSTYGAEPHINHGLHHRGNRHHDKHSRRSDACDRVLGDILCISLSAFTAEKAWPMTHLGGYQNLAVLSQCRVTLISHLGLVSKSGVEVPIPIGCTAIS
eukprot:5367124-Pleurochrysis_carterae.AAC.1